MLKLPLAFLLSASFLSSALPSLGNSLVGTYYLESDEELAVVMFLPDNRYVMIQSGEPEGGGFSGFERGTYTWDDDTEAFTCSVVLDGNGQWGFSHGLAGVEGTSLTLGQGGITIFVPGEGSFSLSRVPTVAQKIVNGWWFDEPGVPGTVNEAGGLVVMVFLQDGTFLFAQDGDPQVDDSGQDGIESGTYVWNAVTGAITFHINTDTNGEWGFSHGGANPTIRIDASGNFLVFDPDEGGETVDVHRNVAGSVVVGDWAAGLGLTGEAAAPNATPFPDGLPNLIRYALNAGSNPAPEDLPRISLEEDYGGLAARGAPSGEQRLVLKYPQRRALVGVKLVPQTSADLVTWTDVAGEEAEALAGDGPDMMRYVFRLPVVSPEEQPDAHRFLRLFARVRD